MEKRDYAVGLYSSQQRAVLTMPGGGRGVEYAAIKLQHCGRDTQIWPRYEQTGDTRDD
jgi:hypothetical protein